MTVQESSDANDRRFRFVATIASGYGVIAISLAINLWLTPFVLSFISRQEYAVFVLAMDAIVWLAVLDLGLTTGLSVRLARIRGSGDSEEMSRLASSAFLAQMGIALVIAAIGVATADWFPRFFAVPTGSRDDAAFVVLAVVVGMALSMPAQTYSAILVAWQRGAAEHMIRFASFAMRVGLTVALLLGGHGLRSLGIAHLVATVASAILRCFAARAIAPEVSTRPRMASVAALRTLSELGAWLSLANLATIAIRGLDRAIAARVVSLEAAAVLELTGRAYQPGITVTGHFVTAAEPLLGGVSGTGDRSLVFSVFRRFFLAATAVTIVLAASLWAANGAFVVWWVGAVNYGGATLDAFLALNMLIYFVIWSHKNLLTVSLVAAPVAWMRVSEAVLNLALSIALGYRFGITGIAAATAIAALVTSVWMIPARAARELSVPFGEWLRRLALPLFLPAVVAVTAAIAARGIAEHMGGFGGAVAGGVIALVAGAPLFWWLAFDTEVRLDVLRMCRGFARRRKSRHATGADGLV